MRRSGLLVALLTLIVAVSLTSCTKAPAPEDPSAMLPPPVDDVQPPPAETPAQEPAATEGAAMTADAVVEQVGAPLYEGATEASVVTEEGVTKATFTTSAAYKDVKDYYMGELKDPDWSNNGFEAGAMGGDEWEWKSADGTKFVMVKSEGSSKPTEIRFTLKPASE